MAQNYPLEWLDALISITLSPKKMYFQDISKEDLQALSEKALIETLHVQSELRNKVFSLHKESQIRLLVRRYHSALIVLLDTATENQSDPAYQKGEVLNLSRTIISCLDELLFFVENRFGNFLSLEERVPPAYLSVARSELKSKADRLKKHLAANVSDSQFTEVVLGTLYGFINSKKNTPTFREVLYYRELVKQLELLGESKNQTSIYTALNELLVYMNFNSRSYISHFTHSIAHKINLLQSKVERIDSLHFHYKEFQQIQTQHSLVLHPDHQGLKEALSKWFSQEISYLEKTLHLAVNPMSSRQSSPVVPAKEEKLTVELSADQLALLLRAADESRLIVAKSMTEVFKSIIPHLSTAKKEHLSYTAVRSKSYNAEERDKERSIEALERMIARIRDY